MCIRVQNGLKQGDIIVAGDHWPILLYKNYIYDSEDVWKGLLRSDILVSVSRHNLIVIAEVLTCRVSVRHLNIYLHPQVLWKRKLRRLAQVMPLSTE